MNKRHFLSLVAAVAATPVFAGALQPVTLDTLTHITAELILVHPDGSEIRYSPAQLEELPTFTLTTTTPWRSDETTFEGVRLQDLLAANGMSEVEVISVVAENDYAVEIPRSAWEALDILVATRANGGPISRRERGPIQFVVDRERYDASDHAREDYLVWMAARIKVTH